MSRKKAAREATGKIDIVLAPELGKLDFEKLESAPGQKLDGIPVNYELSLSRMAKYDLGIEFRITVKEKAPFRLAISYRAIFRVTPDDPYLDPTPIFHSIAKGTGPSVLYPYIRETASSICARAGIAPFTLPLMNFAHAFADSSLEIPPPPENGESG